MGLPRALCRLRRELQARKPYHLGLQVSPGLGEEISLRRAWRGCRPGRMALSTGLRSSTSHLVGFLIAKGGPTHEAQRSLRFGRRLRRSLLSRLVRKPTPGRGLRSFGTQRATSSYSASSRTNDGGVCYLETHDTDRFAGHFRLRLIEFTPTHLVFEIDRPQHRTVEVIYKLSTQRFRRVQRIVHIIFGVEP